MRNIRKSTLVLRYDKIFVMNLLHFENIGLAIGDRKILDNTVGTIEDTDRIGVLGINGAGKSTLLSVLAGKLESDTGDIITKRGMRISYLAQEPAFDNARSVLDNVVGSIHGQDPHWDTVGEAKAVLARFGIEDPDLTPDKLSGGQRKRAALTAAMLTPCDLLILDEPTNHLDHDMIEYLQEWLTGFQGALLVVTHDRYFLDEVTDKIWELDRAKLFAYTGNYSDYLQKKQERLDFAIAAERKMAALYKQDLKWILRGARARSTKQKAHIARFEALRDREKIIEERQVAISSMSSRLGKKTIEISGISKSYGDHTLISDFTYFFNRSDRIGIIGRNGCGKSTLLKMILGIEGADAGSIEVGSTVKFGYFSQENEELDPRDRVIDVVKGVGEFIRTESGLISATMMCERFLFDSDMQYTPVSKLSGGEKRRLYLLKVLMSAPNVLILDEPTNDLDIQTLQVLEDYLDTFNGIIIAVSHDRYFLDRVVSRVFSFESGGKLLQSEGAYTEYIEHKLERDGELPPSSIKTGKVNRNDSSVGNIAVPSDMSDTSADQGDTSVLSGEINTSPKKKKRLTYSEDREYKMLEKQIDELTAKSRELEESMAEAASDFVRLQTITDEKSAVDAELDEKIERFFELEEKLS